MVKFFQLASAVCYPIIFHFEREKGKTGKRGQAKNKIKLSSLSEYVKEIKQGFTRYYNKLNNRRGFFWGQRFKGVMIENIKVLLNCLAYIDLNLIRAAVVEQPEDYRWCTLGYLLQSKNKDDLLSLEFGIERLNKLKFEERLAAYREFVYEIGSLVSNKGKSIDPTILEKSLFRSVV